MKVVCVLVCLLHLGVRMTGRLYDLGVYICQLCVPDSRVWLLEHVCGDAFASCVGLNDGVFFPSKDIDMEREGDREGESQIERDREVKE